MRLEQHIIMQALFSPEFTAQRALLMPIDPFLKSQEGLEFFREGLWAYETSQEAKIVSRDHAPHFDCSEPNSCCILQCK